MLWTDLTWWKRRRERQRDVLSPGGPVTRDAGARDTPTPAGHLLSLDQTGAVGLSRDTFIRSRLNRRRYNEFGHAWNCFLSTAFVCVEFSVPRKWNAEQKSISDQLLPPQAAASQNYNLSLRTHDRQLHEHQKHLSDCNFITRLLYKNSYWLNNIYVNCKL